MATIEEKIAYQKARDMEPDSLRAFLKGVPRDIFLEEVARRMYLTEQTDELDATIKKIKGIA